MGHCVVDPWDGYLTRGHANQVASTHPLPTQSSRQLSSQTLSAIGFDADDTLWHNEDHFAATEQAFADLLAPWATAAQASESLLATEIHNLELFGYGVKSFTLSMIESAMELSLGEISSADLVMLLERGKEMLARPAEIISGVHEVLEHLSNSHRLLVITKGDLHHQERKILHSGVSHHFAVIEVVSEKDPQTYARILDRNGIDPSRFLMVGNSWKSDIAPPVALGSFGAYIPYAFTWAHEQVPTPASSTVVSGASSTDPDATVKPQQVRTFTLSTILEVPALVARLEGR
jgi:putative hydrolase of the HAD superfamily